MLSCSDLQEVYVVCWNCLGGYLCRFRVAEYLFNRVYLMFSVDSHSPLPYYISSVVSFKSFCRLKLLQTLKAHRLLFSWSNFVKMTCCIFWSTIKLNLQEPQKQLSPVWHLISPAAQNIDNFLRTTSRLNCRLSQHRQVVKTEVQWGQKRANRRADGQCLCFQNAPALTATQPHKSFESLGDKNSLGFTTNNNEIIDKLSN